MGNEIIPLYIRVKDSILEKIKSGELPVGTRLRTEQLLADDYNVSRPTVRQSLHELETDGYIERIQGRGTFVISREKNTDIRSRNLEVGFVVPHIADFFIGRIMTGVQESLGQKGVHVSVFITKDNIDKEREIIEDLVDKKVNGIIIHPTNSEYYNPIFFQLKEKNMPFVMTGRHYQYLDSSYVEAENYSGALDAVDYLIKKGHRNIGIVSKPPMIKSSLRDRIQGYHDGMRANGLRVPSRYVMTNYMDTRSVYFDERSEENMLSVYNQLRSFLSKSPELTAIVATNDLIAIDIMNVVREFGKTPGEDFSVIGFDNVGHLDQIKPSLTSVDSPVDDIGKLAGEIIYKHIKCPSLPHQKITIPSKLVVRESCNSCKGD